MSADPPADGSPTDTGKRDDVLVSLEDIDVEFHNEGGLFRDESVVTAVDGVSLDIRENEVVALVGESGCGKTTLGKTAIGLQRPTHGRVTYRGQDIWEARDATGDLEISYEKIRRSLQIIHQDPASSLNPNRVVRTNLAVPLKKYRPDMSAAKRKRAIHRLLERLGLEPPRDYANRFPHELSGGEQQRIALGRTLLMQPDLILADEAVSALDVSLRVEMMDLMLELREMFDTAYLFISHDFANARYLAKKTGGRIGVMYLGDLVEIGPVDEVLENPKHPYTRALVWSTPSIDPRVAADESEAEPPVRSIDIPDPEEPPSGCKFHTRCQEIVVPDGLDLGQSAFNELVDLRLAIRDRDLDTGSVWRDLGVDPGELSAQKRRERADAFVEALYRKEFETDFDSPHRQRVEEALEAVALEEWDRGATALGEHYESVCERDVPELEGSHPVACHLHDGETSSREREAEQFPQ